MNKLGRHFEVLFSHIEWVTGRDSLPGHVVSDFMTSLDLVLNTILQVNGEPKVPFSGRKLAGIACST